MYKRQGYYWFVGRTDDLIKSSGYRISPFEIESVIMEHPAVLECAVTAAPDPVRGQVVKAKMCIRDRDYLYMLRDQMHTVVFATVGSDGSPYTLSLIHIYNLIFSWLAYVDFGGVLSGDGPAQSIPLAEAGRRYAATHDPAEMEDSGCITRTSILLLHRMAQSRRYADVDVYKRQEHGL